MMMSCLLVNKDAINDDVLTLDEEDWIQHDVKMTWVMEDHFMTWKMSRDMT